MKNQKGITLVALVITIIVLLILAGVSISLVVGNNGVLTNATKAVSTNNEAAAEQDVKMAVASCYTDYMSAWATNGNVELSSYIEAEDLNNYLTSGSVTLSSDTYTYTPDDTGATFTITFKIDSSNGDVIDINVVQNNA